MVFRIFTCTWPLVDLCCPESDLSSSIDIAVYNLTVNILAQFVAQFLTMGRSDRWSDDEILKLVAFWADDAVQKQLDGHIGLQETEKFSACVKLDINGPLPIADKTRQPWEKRL